MNPTMLTLRLARDDDFGYIYCLCELTMRSYVEADLGNCFERVSRPTIQKLVQRGMFSKIYVGDLPVGAVACERHHTHLQLEELYIESARQNQGLGTEVMRRLVDQSRSLDLPIRLHVLASNPARAFYEGLGFTITRSTPQVNYMEYIPLNAINDA